MSSRIKTIATLVAIVLVGYSLFVIFYPISIGSDGKTVEIKEGSGLVEITNILNNQGLIRNKHIFVFYVTALGEDRNLKAGKYSFKGRVSMSEIINALSRGLSEHDDIEVTVPEGLNTWEIDEIFLGSGLIRRGDFAKSAIKHEGELHPDTYRFKKDASTEDIIKKMTTNDKFPDVPYEKLTVASMLEKEAKTEEDMKLVAGIIKKRMELGMLLQIDATVTYGACLRQYNLSGKLCDVTLVGVANEIKIDGLYNSYIRKGLPPGPISNPGLKAIAAASDPKDSDYLYYLSTRDGSQIIYSKTADEHLRNRRKYLGF